MDCILYCILINKRIIKRGVIMDLFNLAVNIITFFGAEDSLDIAIKIAEKIQLIPRKMEHLLTLVYYLRNCKIAQKLIENAKKDIESINIVRWLL